ncbi:hypothetical protein OPT61_g3782 [Boeremia exigua]|uniref:Uncharacterized protein n=1 Tax=Boeremia exigua TaxID=749465 RepID=A0ACC2IGM3_9PLEO|nr:hypothetical protein OPT61_g3782 [Boeremia exigua]
MTSILNRAMRLFCRSPWPKLEFPTTGIDFISDEYLVDEETLEGFDKTSYYPVNIGEVFADRYQVVGKLGFGISSTVWLARDLPKYATLKVYTRHWNGTDELEIYKALSNGNSKHPGYKHIRTAQHNFKIARPEGEHLCLVQKPMGDSLQDLLKRTAHHRLPTDVLRMALIQILLALDYVHTDCKLVHTDLKTDNIFLEIEDEGIFEDFVKWEMTHPVARKLGEYPVYGSCSFRRPKSVGALMLGDFGAAARGNVLQSHRIQPNQFQCPEVLFNRLWSYAADIWNLGTLIWDLYENRTLFNGKHPDGSGYHPTAHLTQIIAMLGPPPLKWLEEYPRKKHIFDPEALTLESQETNLSGDEQKEFLQFMQCMLQWRPEDRMTAKQLLGHPWLKARERWNINY